MIRIRIHLKRILWVLPPLLLLGWLIQSGYALFMADIYNRHVNSYLAHWASGYEQQAGDFRITVDELEIALRNAHRAVSLKPEDPEQLLLLANVLQWRPFFASEDSEWLARGVEELDLIRKAVALRPGWPYGWITLAEAKARYSDIDEEFNQALIQAGTLGPWERGVMVRLARLGEYYREVLSDAAKVVTDRNRKRLREAYPGYVD